MGIRYSIRDSGEREGGVRRPPAGHTQGIRYTNLLYLGDKLIKLVFMAVFMSIHCFVPRFCEQYSISIVT